MLLAITGRHICSLSFKQIWVLRKKKKNQSIPGPELYMAPEEGVCSCFALFQCEVHHCQTTSGVTKKQKTKTV